MRITFISRCVDTARKDTEAVLDAHALREGSDKWATVTTKQDLEKVKSLLTNVSTPQTAVACCQTSDDGKKLLWVVGNEGMFDQELYRSGGKAVGTGTGLETNS